jgi:hypothetical protein
MNMAIDVFCHWAPPLYGAAALKAAGRSLRMLERALAMPVMTDLFRPWPHDAAGPAMIDGTILTLPPFRHGMVCRLLML